MIINGNLDLSTSSIISLGNIKKINGDLFLNYCQYLKSLGELEEVTGIFDIDNSSLKSLGKLKYLRYCLSGTGSSLESFGELKYLEGNLYLEGNRAIESLGNLKQVEGNLFLSFCSNLKDLGKLEEVKDGKIIYLNKTKVTREYIIKNKPWLLNQCDWTT